MTKKEVEPKRPNYCKAQGCGMVLGSQNKSGLCSACYVRTQRKINYKKISERRLKNG